MTSNDTHSAASTPKDDELHVTRQTDLSFLRSMIRAERYDRAFQRDVDDLGRNLPWQTRDDIEPVVR